VSSASAKPLVLIVEDDVSVRRSLATGLPVEGFRVLEASTVRDAIRDARQYVPDVVVLDLGLPDHDGIEVLRDLRTWSAIPVIILSARELEGQKVTALDAGADDYVTKPFGFAELVARLRAALRRAARPRGEGPSGVFEAGPVRVDLEHRRVTVDGEEVDLTPMEYRILALLVRHGDRVVTQGLLARELWGPGAAPANPAIRVHMTHLRRKLAPDPTTPGVIETLPGVGYRLRADERA
jgi:two-component system KDP operon response regulator KdpE